MHHTATMQITVIFDIDKAIKLCRRKEIKRVAIHRIKLLGLGRSKRSGFSKKRYEAASLKYPIIVTTEMELIDGRHRLLKAMEMGRTFINVVCIDHKELETCII